MRVSEILGWISLLASSTTASPLSLQKRVTCTEGAVVFALRGSDREQTTVEPNPRYNVLPSGMNNTANAIISEAGGNSYLQAIQYPAVRPDPPSFSQYSQSVNQGAQALRSAVLNYTESCSKGKIFILGFSQGAQATSIALGSAQRLGACGRITGVALFGDPTFIDNVQPIDEGDAENNGRNGTGANSGRTLYPNLNSRFPARLRSYCQALDQYCDSGTVNGTSQSIHLNAPQYFQKDATAFLTSKI